MPEIRLGRATTTGAGTRNADGSLTPFMDDLLVFEMIWAGELCLPTVTTGAGTAGILAHLLHLYDGGMGGRQNQ